MTKSSLTGALVLLCSIPWAEATPQPLNIKPGLWEMTRVREVNGKTETRRSCVKKQDLSDPFNFYRGGRTILRTTSTALDFETSQFGTEASEVGTLHMKVLDAENVQGQRQLTGSYVYERRTYNQSYTFTAKWIGPSCRASKK